MRKEWKQFLGYLNTLGYLGWINKRDFPPTRKVPQKKESDQMIILNLKQIFGSVKTVLGEARFYLFGESSDIKFWGVPSIWERVKYYFSGRGWIHHLIRRMDR